jgi:tRNA modification GTPase
MRDTIFALASGAGRAAVAIIRISGPDARGALSALAGRLPPPRRASLRTLRSPETAEVLDRALVLWFPGPDSFTGEDQVELQTHGGWAVIEAAFGALRHLGLRAAAPGEFTRRAFETGKLDLIEAEGVADLVDAETQAQRRQALSAMSGSLSERAAVWRRQLLDGLALLEAGIDFADEALPGGLVELATIPLTALRRDLISALGDRRGFQVRDGFRVALIGLPNAGKSSLFNALIGRDAAIVTSIPGTTRDVIEAVLVLEGYRVVLADTAGLRVAEDVIEAEGVRRAQAWARSADLRLWVLDQEDGASSLQPLAESDLKPGDAVVINKVDVGMGLDYEALETWGLARGLEVLRSAAIIGDVAHVEAFVRERIISSLGGGEIAFVTRARHHDLLSLAVAHLDAALDLQRGPELIAEDVRLAGRALERLSGRISSEDVLDQVFSTFCIGK